jgi:putative intracellular protease/amidase
MSHKLLHRLIVLGIVLALCLVLVPGCSQSQPKQVLMILSDHSVDTDYMLTNEVGVMKDMLTQAGFKVVTASDSGQPLGSGNTTLKPDLKIANVKMADYIGLIDPCLGRDMAVMPSPETLALVKDAVAQGKVIASQLGGVDDLYQAGVMEGKQYAFVEDASGYFPKAIYKGIGVVQDGKIITAGVCPEMAKIMGLKDTTAELTQRFIDALKL